MQNPIGSMIGQTDLQRQRCAPPGFEAAQSAWRSIVVAALYSQMNWINGNFKWLAIKMHIY